MQIRNEMLCENIHKVSACSLRILNITDKYANMFPTSQFQRTIHIHNLFTSLSEMFVLSMDAFKFAPTYFLSYRSTVFSKPDRVTLF